MPATQRAVWRNGGLSSSEVLFNFAALTLGQVAVETRHCPKLQKRWLQCARCTSDFDSVKLDSAAKKVIASKSKVQIENMQQDIPDAFSWDFLYILKADK